MSTLDPFTLLIASALFAASLAAVTLVSRVGLGPLALGMRTWLLGDLFILAGHAAMLGETSHLAPPLGLPVLTLSNAMIVAGAAYHWLAIGRHQKSGMGTAASAAIGLGIGIALGIATSALGDTAHRSQIFNLSMIILLGLTIRRAMRSVATSWGARLMAAALTFAVCANAAMLGHAPTSDAMIVERSVIGMMIGLAMTLLTSSALLLWLQQELCGQLVQTAATDALTGALNRHGLLPQLRRELMACARSKAPVTVALCDLDHFKRINDEYGHPAGDEVLVNFVTAANALLRGSDIIARWGGEEFLLVMPRTATADAVIAMERLRLNQRPARDGLPRVSFSAGIATACAESSNYDIEHLLATADARLYKAKETRDRVVAEYSHVSGEAQHAGQESPVGALACPREPERVA